MRSSSIVGATALPTTQTWIVELILSEWVGEMLNAYFSHKDVKIAELPSLNSQFFHAVLAGIAELSAARDPSSAWDAKKSFRSCHCDRNHPTVQLER